MLEILYFIFIFPIQSLLDMLLSLFFSLTQSYGVSLIFLSLSVQIFLLKLTGYFERKTALFNALKASVNAKREEFKRVFKGSELLSYTRILYKQRHFHPIFALFGLGGLALQIPIFIALIVLVQEAEFLKGVGFLWLSDLSQADRLNAQVFGLSLNMVHILPILMCALSVANVLYQSKEKGEVIQGLSLALIFLVLLYDMPSALVLYWSTNMLFALLKALWQKQAQTRKQEGEKEGKRRQGQNAQAYQETLHDQKRSPQVERLQGGLEEAFKEGCASRTFEADALHRSEALKLKVDTQERREQVSEKGEINKRDEKGSKSQQGFHQKGSIKEVESNTQGVRLTWWQRGRGLIKHSFQALFTPYENLSAKEYKTYRDISILALVNICFMICVFSPFAVYSSDVSQFDPNQTYQTLGALFGVFLLSSLLLVYITSFFYHTRFLKLGAYGVSVILLIGVVYTFVLRGDYGVMDHFVLQKLNFANVELRGQKIMQALLTCLGSAFFALLILKRLKVCFGIMFFTLGVLSIMHIYTIQRDMGHYTLKPMAQDDQDTNQPYEKELFSYSKTEKNIIVMVLDMFSGSHMHAILEQFPEFRRNLDGFVLFDNAVSTTNSTIHSVAPIISGEYYTTYNMNERKDILTDSIAEAFGRIGDTFIKNNYDVAYFTGAITKQPNDIQKYNQDIFVTINMGEYREWYVRNKDNLLESIQEVANRNKNSDIIRLLSVGLFRFVPELYFRSRMYNDGLWLLSLGEKEIQTSLSSLLYDSSMYAFSKIHNTESTKPTFKYLHSMISHSPYGLYYDDGKCTYLTSKTAWDEYPHKQTMYYRDDEDRKEMFQHYDSEVCALSYLNDLIEWLKSEGIYDNTQLFVVSDHGGYDSLNISEKLVKLEHRPDALFLFKDFNSQGTLQTDSRLMVNYDISSIFCENLPDGCPNVPANILKNYPKSRSVITTIPISWDLAYHKPNQWILNHIYRVKDNIYEESNWQDITQEVKDGKIKFNGIYH